tara:strand:+ start:193 stop:384 length:192 start_codon:yes stop_codon:yes gene_type:complete
MQVWLEHCGPNDYRLFDSDPDEGQVGMSYDFESLDAAMLFAKINKVKITISYLKPYWEKWENK